MGIEHGNPLRRYSIPLTYKSFENPTSLDDKAEESSDKAEAINLNPTINLRYAVFRGDWFTLTSVFFPNAVFTDVAEIVELHSLIELFVVRGRGQTP